MPPMGTGVELPKSYESITATPELGAASKETSGRALGGGLRDNAVLVRGLILNGADALPSRCRRYENCWCHFPSRTSDR